MVADTGKPHRKRKRANRKTGPFRSIIAAKRVDLASDILRVARFAAPIKDFLGWYTCVHITGLGLAVLSMFARTGVPTRRV
jgi:hypothetical protein